MLIAKSQKSELILASRQLEKSAAYSCPSCHRAVYLKTGPVTRPHFAHFQKEACDVFSEGETEEHLEGKLQLREWLERQKVTVEMEAYLPELKQRPDLLVHLGEQKLAIEFQCSSIPIAKVVERTQGYLMAGYQVVWILGEKFRYERKLTAFQKACLAEVKEQLVLFHYSVTKERLEYWYGFQLSQKQKMSGHKKSLRKGCVLRLDLSDKTKRKDSINYEIAHHKLMRQFANGNAKHIQQLFYEKGETLVSLPKEAYTTLPHEWMIHTHPLEWKLRFIWWLETFPLKTIITKRMLWKWLETVSYYAMPQMTDTQRMQPLLEWIETLTQTNVLKQIRFGKWSIQQYPKRFKHLEDKLKIVS